ncbi:carbohydrate ABC transporter permease [Labrys wisconsinensis]|uniref:Multiple sugar transport system permease protein n=1 Tax=Labrys wisconsinensis TaxID=425677 RepID=A0ABU0JLY2_9HYPH|nr:carbohydrate ABC transporter permease [Labrys wisconsinensis]MDQ0474388.1 multiple sugar transport system permease protein [Labrys wisconsinensis]
MAAAPRPAEAAPGRLGGLIRPAALAAGILLALAVALAPFFVLFGNSLRPADEFLSDKAGLWPSRLTFDYYAAVLSADSTTLHILLNSLVVTTATTLISVSTGCLVAYALARLRLPFRLSTVIGLTFLIVRFYPKITIAIPYFVLMRDLGLRDTYAAVVIAHVSMTLPVVVWLMLAFFEDFPRQIEQSAMMDGCGLLRRFFVIVLPLTMPAIATAALLTAFFSWNEFLFASAVGPLNARTLPVEISGFITDKGTAWGPMSAMGTIIVLPVMLLALAAQRYLVRGLTAGAVKG